MAQETTPMDEISGLPLLIAPRDEVIEILDHRAPQHDSEGRPIADWNHVWHPAREVINAGRGGVALRNSRVQLVMRDEHEEYHAYFAGPELPRRPAERFSASVLCAAGYIPMQAMAFNSDGPKIVNLTPLQRDRLRQSGEVRAASLSVVHKFVKEFVMAQAIDVKPRVADKYLRLNPSESSDATRQHHYLTHLLLSLAIDQIEELVREPYSFAHGAELLTPGVPERADLFVLSCITKSRSNVRGVAQDLTKKLAAQRRLAEVA